MKALVTGGAGFIGSHIVDKLISMDYEVVIIDNLYTGQKENINPKAKFYLQDIRDEETYNIIINEKPDYIFHTAAQMSVPYSVENPKFDLDVNGNGTLNLIKASLEINLKKFIFSSTGGVIYGHLDLLPTKEEVILHPLCPYGITKLLCENYLHFYKHEFGLNYTALRYGNVYGPRQANAHESGVITIFARKILKNEDCKIYSYDDQPGGMVRDYIYISDVVNANIAAMDSDSGVYNVGTGIGTNTQRLYDLITGYSGNKPELTLLPPRKGEIRSIYLDISRTKEKFNWQPEVELQEGMKKTIDYFKVSEFKNRQNSYVKQEDKP